MTAKAVCLRIKVAQLKYFGWKLPEYCNTWKCFTYSFEAEKQGDFLFTFYFILFFYFMFSLKKH